MISFQQVSKFYRPNCAALQEVSFEIASGEFVSITGKSGAGKTTLIRLLLGEEKPDRGKVLFDNKDVSKLRARLLPKHRRSFGIVFQDYKLLPRLTVYENVAYALEVTGANKGEIKNHVPQALEIVDMLNKAASFPHQLSGGEKQRVAIARAIIHRPNVIIADEPTGNLDPYHSWEIIKLLLKIHELGANVILSTHDREVINHLQRRVITLDNGRVVRDAQRGRYIL